MWKVDVAHLLKDPISVEEWTRQLKQFVRDHEKESTFVPTYLSLEQKQSFLEQSCHFLIQDLHPSNLIVSIMDVLRLFCRENIALETLSTHYPVR
jgi:hypothetical protein